MLPEVSAIRYVTPFREGGSLPGLMEADDYGTYVVKFRGAGQGPKALVAEIIVGELARRLGFRVPDLAIVHIEASLPSAEPDEEVQDLLRASAGANLGIDFLPGSLGYDPAAFRVDPELAARVVWLDAFTENVDRSWRNPNLLLWHKELWLIDHGASLYFHHNWARAAAAVERSFDVSEHVLTPHLGDVRAAGRALAPRVTPELLREVLALVPDAWLDDPAFDDPGSVREAYVEHLVRRAASTDVWLKGVPA